MADVEIRKIQPGQGDAMIIAVWVIGAILSLFSSVPVGHADDCSALMANDLAISTKNNNELTAIYHMACGMNYEEYSKSMGANTSASYGLFGGDAAYDENSHKIFQSEHCTEYKTDQYRSSAYYHYRSSPNQAALNNVLACLRDKNLLTCLPEPLGNDVNVVVYWASLMNGQSTLKLLKPGGGHTSVTTALSEGSSISKGSNSVVLGWNKSQGLSLVADVEQNGAAFNCTAFVAPERPVIDGPVTEVNLYTFDIVAYNNMAPTNPEEWSWYPVNTYVTVDPTKIIRSELSNKQILRILEVSTADQVICSDNCPAELTHSIASISADVIKGRWIEFIVRARGSNPVHPRYTFTVEVEEVKG